LWAALRFEWAYTAVAPAGTIQKRLVIVHCATRPELLSARAVVEVASRVILKVAAREGAIVSLRLVVHRNMWRDALLLDQPVQHRSRPVGGIGRKPLRLETEALLGPFNHGPRRADLGLANGAGGFDVNDDAELHVDESCRSTRRTLAPCEPRSTAPPDRMARQTSGRRRWRRPRLYHRALPDTPSPHGWTSRDRDPCTNPAPRSSAACWRRLGSGSHRLQSLRRQPDRPQCTPRRHAQTRDEKHPPRENARCGHARTPNDPGQHPRYRACRTSDRRGSPALHDRSIAPSGSQRHNLRPASGSSVPDRSTGDPWTNNGVQVRSGARTDREQCRSSAPCDLRERHRQDETRRTVDLGHSSDGPSWIDLAEIRVTTTESRFAACLNRLLQQNLPIG